MNASFLQEELMDHYKFARNRRTLAAPDFEVLDDNPSCGDRVCIGGNVSGNILKELGFQAEGCILSQAATSMLVDDCTGKTIEEVASMGKKDILRMVGIPLGPTRMKCALLCLDVLRRGVCTLQQQKNSTAYERENS